MKQTNTMVIGAGLSGLACAACLQKQSKDYIIIEKQNQVAVSWRQHYDRLHLHTSKRYSHLPFKKFGRTIPKYPGRQQVIDYLDSYQNEFNIHPVFNTEAVSVRFDNGVWVTVTNNGTYQSKYLIVAMGPYSKPRSVHFRGMETFPGKIIHSCEYKTGKNFTGQNVLVVGFGNSACEIAIDLFEQGAVPSMSVRSPVNIVPRDIFGIPVLELSMLLRWLPPRIADFITAPFVNALVGDITKLGLRKKSYGPMEEIHRNSNIPLLDIGTISLIREGHIKVYDNIDQITGRLIYFENGKRESFDAIIAGIGYCRDYAEIISVGKHRFDDLKVSAGRQKYYGEDGLYFCGYWISPNGQIREIGLDAQKIVASILKKDKGS